MSLALNPENYYSLDANHAYMSATRLKGYISCEARQHAIDTGAWAEEPTDAMLAGSYVHAVVEGSMESFRAEHPEMFVKSSELKATFRQADEMAKTLLSDTFVRSMLTGQHEEIVTAELFGVPFKAKIDVLHPTRIVDVKTVSKLNERVWSPMDGRYVGWIEDRKYLMQLSIYTELVRLTYEEDEWRLPLIVAVTKENPPDKAILAVDEATISDELQKVREHLPHVMDVALGLMEPVRCEHCAYCRATKQIKRIIQWQDLTI